jgi:hypothetical protein
MHSRTLESIVAQVPARRTISRIAIVVLCVGLFIGPTLGLASSGRLTGSGASGGAAPQLSSPAGYAAAATNTSSGKPIATVKNVKIAYGGAGTRLPLTFTATVVKLNESTVLVRHQHNQTVKQWSLTDDAVVDAALWAFAPGGMNQKWKDELSLIIQGTPTFKHTIKPSVRSHHKTGTDGYKQKGRETRENIDETYNLPDIPGPVEAAKDIYRAGINGLSTAAAGFIDSFHWVVLHLPAPGSFSEPTTWFPGTVTPLHTTPAANSTVASSGSSRTTNSSAIPIHPPKHLNVDGWWQTVWTIYGGLAALVVLPIFVAWIYAWAQDTKTPREREQHVRQLAFTLGMVLGGVLLLPFALHLANQLALGIVPSGTAFMQTPESVATLGLGLALGSVLLLVEAGLVIVALVILFVEWVLVYLLVAAWPVFAVCLGSGNRYLRPYGDSAVVAFVSLLALKLVQAVWLRFLLNLPLSWSDPGMTLMTIGATIVGLGLGFIYLPYYVVTNLLPEFVTSVGTGTAGRRRRSHHQYTGADASAAQGGSERQRPTPSPSTNDHGQSDARTRTRLNLEAHSLDAATDGGQTAQSQSHRSRDRSRRVDAIRQRAYRQDDTFDQFPDTGDVSDTVSRTRTTADTGSSGRTPDGVAGTAVETTESVVGKAESAAGKVGTAVAVAAELRRNAKTRWEGAKRYWHTSLPGNRSRRPLKPVEPLSKKVRRNAKAGWKGAKQRGRAGTDRLVDRDRRQRRETRREHVHEQQDSAEEPTEETTTETETTTTSAEESTTDTTATERRRYYTRQDHQRFGDALSERQKSSIRRHAERRYRSRPDAAASDQTSHSADEGEETSTENETDDTE